MARIDDKNVTTLILPLADRILAGGLRLPKFVAIF
jgi:hypothetical protein